MGLWFKLGSAKVGFAVWTATQLSAWFRASVRHMLKPLRCGQKRRHRIHAMLTIQYREQRNDHSLVASSAY